MLDNKYFDEIASHRTSEEKDILYRVYAPKGASMTLFSEVDGVPLACLQVRVFYSLFFAAAYYPLPVCRRRSHERCALRTMGACAHCKRPCR